MRYIILCVLLLGTFNLKATRFSIKKERGGNYILNKDGIPFYIKGAAGDQYLEKVKACGGNSIRIWSSKKAPEILNQAKALDLYATVGLDIASEKDGFDYNDEIAVQKQFEAVKKVVLNLKNHPALMMWAVGTELDIEGGNPKVWNAVNAIVKMIHEVDPNHPTTTTLAGVSDEHIQYIIQRCQALDILDINTFKDLPNVKEKITSAGWKGPYIIGAWGSSGYWEVDTTAWGAAVEETSTEKAKDCSKRYKNCIWANRDRCLGSYVFCWGENMNHTRTFFSLILNAGEETASVDVMKNLWSDSWPENRAPEISQMKLDGKNAIQNLYLQPGTVHSATINVSDPENEVLGFFWEIRTEERGNSKSAQPLQLKEGLIQGNPMKTAEFKVPKETGAYRIYVYVRDGHKKIATANFPFYVDEKQKTIVKSVVKGRN